MRPSIRRCWSGLAGTTYKNDQTAAAGGILPPSSDSSLVEDCTRTAPTHSRSEQEGAEGGSLESDTASTALRRTFQHCVLSGGTPHRETIALTWIELGIDERRATPSKEKPARSGARVLTKFRMESCRLAAISERKMPGPQANSTIFPGETGPGLAPESRMSDLRDGSLDEKCRRPGAWLGVAIACGRSPVRIRGGSFKPGQVHPRRNIMREKNSISRDDPAVSASN